MYVRQGDPSTDSDPIVYTIRINGVASTITASLAGTATNGSDLANTESVSAGDSLDVEVTKANAVTPAVEEITVTVEFIG
jgi:hypothetical protein